MNLSKRLKIIEKFVKDDDTLIDVGCDHALLDIYLTLKRNIKCIAADINKNALSIARANIKKYNLDIKLVLSNGVDNISLNGNEIIVISGMGTKTILDIIRNKKITNQKLIIQSNTEIFLLRKSLKKLGYHIIDEEVVCEKNKYYPTLFLKKGKESRNCLIGNLLYKENGVNYVKYLLEKLNKNYVKMPFSLNKIKLKFKIIYLKNSLSKYLRSTK